MPSYQDIPGSLVKWFRHAAKQDFILFEDLKRRTMFLIARIEWLVMLRRILSEDDHVTIQVHDTEPCRSADSVSCSCIEMTRAETLSMSQGVIHRLNGKCSKPDH